MNDVTMHVGETHPTSSVLADQSFMIDPEQMKHRRMKIMDLERSIDRAIAELIRGAEGHAAPDTTTRHPDGIAMGVVIATVGSLGERRAAEFTGPDDQGLVEHSPHAEILEQRGDRLIDRMRVLLVAGLEGVVLVPSVGTHARAGEFDEANASFDESPCEQTLPAVDPRPVVRRVQTVELPRRLRFGRDVHEFGNGPLHPEGEFLIPDRGIDRIVTLGPTQVHRIERPDQVELADLFG